MATIFSNPAAAATGAAEDYVRALLAVLGDRDPLAVMTELVPWAEQTVRSLDPATLPPARGTGQVVGARGRPSPGGHRAGLRLSGTNGRHPGHPSPAGLRSGPLGTDVSLSRRAAHRRAVQLGVLAASTCASSARWSRRNGSGPGFTASAAPRAWSHRADDRGNDLVHRRRIERILSASMSSPPLKSMPKLSPCVK